jgi:hypothetical protein
MLKPAATADAVAEAHRRGRTVDDLIDLISDDLLAEVGTVIAGTPRSASPESTRYGAP